MLGQHGCGDAAMTFYELIWRGEGCGDAADLEEALAFFQELKPKTMDWQAVCEDPQYSPTIRRYRSFEAFLDNEDEVETIHPTAELLQRFAPDGPDA
jgi:hypothetical protein